MSASKVDGFSNPEKTEPGKSSFPKRTARALRVDKEQLATQDLPGIPPELEAGLALPNPAERRRILERAGLLIAEARSLLERLDCAEQKSGVMINGKAKEKAARSVHS